MMLNTTKLNSQTLNSINYIYSAYTGILLELIVQDFNNRVLVVQNIDNAELTVYNSYYIGLKFIMVE